MMSVTSLFFLLDYLPSELSWPSLDVKAQRPLVENILNFDIAAVLIKLGWCLFVNAQAFAIKKINLKDFWFAINQVESQMVVNNAIENFRCYIIKQYFQKIAQIWSLQECLL